MYNVKHKDRKLTLKQSGIAAVETNPENDESYIVVRVGPFKDRRAAQRKLTELVNNPDHA